MDEKEILQLAREVFDYDFAQSSAAPAARERLIAFANAIENRTLERAAGIVEDWDSDSADPREVAAAIRGEKRD